MQIHREAILQIVQETLDEMGQDLEKPELCSADENTRLFGARSPLDSMNLVNLIADIEERISDAYGIDILLANERAMSRSHSPFRRVSSCTDYIMELIEEASHE